MRLTCPLCGPRDRREFYYYGSEDYLQRPGPDAGPEAWDDHLHLRDNLAGEVRDGDTVRIDTLPDGSDLVLATS